MSYIFVKSRGTKRRSTYYTENLLKRLVFLFEWLVDERPDFKRSLEGHLCTLSLKKETERIDSEYEALAYF